MKYAMLIYIRSGSEEALPKEEYEKVSDEYMALRSDPRCLTGGHLQPVDTARTLRIEDGRTLTTDGPYADTKEVFGGFYVFEAGNLDEALEVAARIPAARMGGAIEVRPLAESDS